jgi:ubiquinone/menaquinone biosynthesis C-methylase UbiE
VTTDIEHHYSAQDTDGQELARRIRAALSAAGTDLGRLTPSDLAPVDEFHIRGRAATLELAAHLALTPDDRVLDLGSGLGGPARTLAEVTGCHVTGIDLTRAFTAAATELSTWVGLADRVHFVQGDATDLPFPADHFDAAVTIHAAMNIPAKDQLYAEARRVLKPGRRFVIYDVLQGEGGPVIYPVPWARDPSLSALATPEEMRALLAEAGFAILAEQDTTDACVAWFRGLATQGASPGIQLFMGADFPQMVRNQVQNLTERRIRVVTYVCRG